MGSGYGFERDLGQYVTLLAQSAARRGEAARWIPKATIRSSLNRVG